MNYIENEFVPHQESLELKKLGFNEPCFAVFPEGSKLLKINGEPRNWNDNIINGETTSAPTFSQAFRWFREKYDLIYVIIKAESWFFTINGCNTQEGFNTYEKAELACLRKLIEIIKENKKI